MTSITPKKFFQDNMNLISARNEPVQWNLNAGLFHLCEQIEQLAHKVRSIEDSVDSIKRDVRGR